MSKAAELANLIGNINAGGGGVNRNLIINGAMNVCQRATSSTDVVGGAYYVQDRWRVAGITSGRFTMSQDSSAPSGFANSMKLDCTTADTSIASNEYLYMHQRIEGQNLQTIGKGTSDAVPITVSFYVKGNASATYTVELHDSDNSRFNSQEFSVTTDWTKVTKTFIADTTGTLNDDNGDSLRLNFWIHAGSDYTGGTHTDNVWHTTTNQRVGDSQSSFFDSTDRTFFLTGVQLELGQNATSFEHEPYETTLLRCQRYYYKSHTYSLSIANGTNDVNYTFREEREKQHCMPVNMRAGPTFVAVQSAASLGTGTIRLYGNYDFVVAAPSGYGGDLPADNYWYGGYTADAEI